MQRTLVRRRICPGRESRDTRCIIDAGEPVTLEVLMRDYLGHLRHHLAQF